MDTNAYQQYIENFDINLLDCGFLGKGHNGVVYMLPDNKVIKICFEEESCKKEYFILNRVNKNKYFPKVYGMLGNYMIRDYVNGTTLKKYIKEKGMDKVLAIKVVELLEEFIRLNFSKIDIRCKDIIVRPDKSLMIIDPKKFYSKTRDYPRHLCKGLYKLGVLGTFMNALREEKPELYSKWHTKIRQYIGNIKRGYN